MQTVLIVDDEYAIAESLRDVLADEGYRVFLAADGEEALTALAAEAIDLVLMDVMMPRLNGTETLARMRADGNLSKIPVIMMSAAPEWVVLKEPLPVAFLHKPFDLQALLSTVSAALPPG